MPTLHRQCPMPTRLCINLERSWSANFQEIHGGRTAFLEVDNSARYSLPGSHAGAPRGNAMASQWAGDCKKTFLFLNVIVIYEDS